ncbi:protein-disulfide reductase DsbD domain-containing protein [Tropicibacter sp. R15_0]|uniref:protein-disulfide reductase DsbD domain-containing protein n=1 Tax=Tropicibacter sp. R15_0 TaxID=2821101 RepID=UPI002570087B|nr:protein-disulfide reductase DsbD domain-containing protein [Tropicibacter sp. R15_0]
MSEDMKNFVLAIACLFLPLVSSGAAQAESYENVIRAELRPGWRLPDGSHMAALHLELAPGWKTYWRAPGDAGIPPQFRWKGSGGAVQVHWPAPQVFHQSGMRSVGYSGSVTLPLRVSLRNSTKDARLKGVIDIGICKDVCLPHRVRVEAVLPATKTKPDPSIAAALADEPYSAEDAGVSSVSCRVAPAPNGMMLRAQIDMPKGTGREHTVIEAANPEIWVGEPRTWWEGGHLMAEAQMAHMAGSAFAVDRSRLRITVLGGHMPVDIHGCSG